MLSQQSRAPAPAVRPRAPPLRDMNLCGLEPRALIEIAEPDVEFCPCIALLPEGNVKLRNYRLLNENLRAYTPTGDVHTSPAKGKLVARFDACATVSPPRARILELVRPEDPGREALEAIVRPAPRRGLSRPLDEDARRFLQRTLLSPSPYISNSATPEQSPCPPESPENSLQPEPPRSPIENRADSSGERSLADELREAEEEKVSGGVRQDLVRDFHRREGGSWAAGERERLGRLALAVEEDEAEGAGLSAAARRLDALLVESRALHRELAAIHEDLQAQSARAGRCAAAARGLAAETRALRYLDDVVALLRGDVQAAVRARAWPFALGCRAPGRNYIV